MDLNNETILTKYKPLSPWAYFGYNILFNSYFSIIRSTSRAI